MVENCYEVLGISRTASRDEIKAAWRELMRQVHPDTIRDASAYVKKLAEERAKEINAAYQVLSDPVKRRLYDQQLDAYYRQGQPPTAPGSTSSQAGHAQGSKQTTPSSGGTTSTAPPSASGSSTHQGTTSPTSGWGRPAAAPISKRLKVAWSVFCLMWGGLWSLGLYSPESLGMGLLAFAMAFGSFAWAAWICARPIGRVLSWIGVTKFRKQVYAAASAIALGLSAIVIVGAANRPVRVNSPTQPAPLVTARDARLQPGYIRARTSSGLIQDIAQDRWLDARQSDPGLTVLQNAARSAGTPGAAVPPEQRAPAPPSGFTLDPKSDIFDRIGSQSANSSAKPPRARPVEQPQTGSDWEVVEDVGFQGRDPSSSRTAAVKPPARKRTPSGIINGRAALQKLCAFGVGTWPCGFGAEETIATLRGGDRVKVLSGKRRAKDGSDIYEVRTIQGWEGWVDAVSLTLEDVEDEPEAESPLFGNATVKPARAALQKLCAFGVGTWPCGFGAEETLAMLRAGDRVKVLSGKIRAKDGNDIYNVRTLQGWEGWLTVDSLMFDQ